MKTRTTARFALLAALSTLAVAPSALAYDDGSEVGIEGTADGEAATDEDAGSEDQYVDEGEYCGGDEGSPLGEADMLLGEEDWTGLYHTVGTLLREGRADWQRAQALSYLATAELHMGRPWAAARNFRIAFAVDAEQVSPALHAEHAVALLRSGQNAAAYAEASTFVEGQCQAPESWMVPSCWAAHTVMAASAPDAAASEAAQDRADAVLPQSEELLGQVATYRKLLGYEDGRDDGRVASR